ncbi:hypothetical protein [Streptomyces coeruleorubidus]|uniref:hypothetical protein n=1 Tax=Streptomyces coeruleorubidus TaxID=116188 RepID=UPI0037B4A5D3
MIEEVVAHRPQFLIGVAVVSHRVPAVTGPPLHVLQGLLNPLPAHVMSGYFLDRHALILTATTDINEACRVSP